VQRGRLLFRRETRKRADVAELKKTAFLATGEAPEVHTTYWEYRAWLNRVTEEGDVEEFERTFSSSRQDEARRAAEAEQEMLLRDAVARGVPLDSCRLNDFARLRWGQLKRVLVHEKIRNRGSEDRAMVTSAPTVGELIQSNLDRKRANKSVEASTLQTDVSFFEHWVKRKLLTSKVRGLVESPYALADVRISYLSQPVIQEFVDALSRAEHRHGKDGLSRATIENILGVVSSAWRTIRNHPQYSEFYPRVNFREDVVLPKKAIVRPNSRYSFDEVERLIAACDDDLDRAVLGLSLMGIRAPGESAGVTVDDFFAYRDHTFLRVHQQIDVVDGVRMLKAYTKTGSQGSDEGVRELLVLPRLLRLIEPCAERARALNYRFVLHSDSGEGETYGSVDVHVPQVRFDALKARAGIHRKGATLYALRKTVTSHAKEVGGTDLAQVIGGWRGRGVFSRHYDEAEMLDFQIEHMPKMRWAEEPVAGVTAIGAREQHQFQSRSSELDDLLANES